jgi:hypothetical protein
MRFTLIASSFLRLNLEAKASAILRRFFPSSRNALARASAPRQFGN